MATWLKMHSATSRVCEATLGTQPCSPPQSFPFMAWPRRFTPHKNPTENNCFSCFIYKGRTLGPTLPEPTRGIQRGHLMLKGLSLSVQGAGDPKEKNNIQVLTESKCVWRGKDLGLRVLCVYRWSSYNEAVGFPSSSQGLPRRGLGCMASLPS